MNHHRTINFIKKIDSILSFLKSENSSLFNTFCENKIIHLFYSKTTKIESKCFETNPFLFVTIISAGKALSAITTADGTEILIISVLFFLTFC